jgi:hypothetical protein
MHSVFIWSEAATITDDCELIEGREKETESAIMISQWDFMPHIDALILQTCIMSML